MSITLEAGKLKRRDASLVLTSLPPADVILESVIVFPTQVTIDDPVTVRCHIRDKRGWYEGLLEAEFTLICSINGIALSQHVIVPLQGEIDVDFEFTPESIGLSYRTYTATVLDRFVSFDVKEVIEPVLYQGVYYCPFCGATFETKDLFIQHLIENAPWTQWGSLKCPYCNKSWYGDERAGIVTQLIEHIETNHVLFCPFCDMVFTWAAKVEEQYPDERLVPLGEHFRIDHIPPPPTISAPQVFPLACTEGYGESADVSSFGELIRNVAYREQYPTLLAFEGPAYHFRIAREGGEATTVGTYYCDDRIAGPRIKYSDIPASGIKIYLPYLEGKNWNAYIDYVIYTVPKTGWLGSVAFQTLAQFSGSGSMIKYWRDLTEDRLRALGRKDGGSIMLRIDTGGERILIIYPYFVETAVSKPLLNIEEELAHLETHHIKEVKILEKCRSELISLYRYEGWTSQRQYCKYRPDGECANECSMKLLDRTKEEIQAKGTIWCESYKDSLGRTITTSHVTYTLAEVESAYSSKMATENAYYNEQKSILGVLRDKYGKNWVDC